MRAPPESLTPMTGTRLWYARSITLQTFSANTSPSDPPKAAASWLKTITSRPSVLAARHRRAVAPRPQLAEGRHLRLLVLRADPHDLDGVGPVALEAVEADDDALARLDPALHPVGGLGDPALHPARLDGGHGAAPFVHLGHDAPGLLLHPVRQRLHVVGAAQRVRDGRDAGLVGDHLLRPQRHLGGLPRGQAQRL